MKLTSKSKRHENEKKLLSGRADVYLAAVVKLHSVINETYMGMFGVAILMPM